MLKQDGQEKTKARKSQKELFFKNLVTFFKSSLTGDKVYAHADHGHVFEFDHQESLMLACRANRLLQRERYTIVVRRGSSYIRFPLIR